jgi:hypothetical protein
MRGKYCGPRQIRNRFDLDRLDRPDTATGRHAAHACGAVQ